MIVYAEGGLCNMLRVTFSYYLLCKRKREDLTIIWKTTNACPGFFLDYFEEVDGITFLQDNSQNLKIDVSTCYAYPEFDKPGLFIYSDLKLKQEIYNIVRERINALDNNYIAIQVRRTDHVVLAKKHNMFTTDDDFFKFVDANTEGNLYISSDNKISYDLFRSKYSNRVKFTFPEGNGTMFRHTTLKDAIIDIYVCAHAKKVKVSGYSTFGQLILHLHTNFIF
jgi:hypothetical protein